MGIPETPEATTRVRLQTQVLAMVSKEDIDGHMRSMLGVGLDQLTHGFIRSRMEEMEEWLVASIPGFANEAMESDEERNFRVEMALMGTMQHYLDVFRFMDTVCLLVHPEDLMKSGLVQTGEVLGMIIVNIIGMMQIMNLTHSKVYVSIKQLHDMNLRDRMIHCMNSERFMNHEFFHDKDHYIRRNVPLDLIPSYRMGVYAVPREGRVSRFSIRKLSSMSTFYDIRMVFGASPVLERLRFYLKRLVAAARDLFSQDIFETMNSITALKHNLMHEVFQNIYVTSFQPTLASMTGRDFVGIGTVRVRFHFAFDEEDFQRMFESGIVMSVSREDYRDFLGKLLMFNLVRGDPHEIWFTVFRMAFSDRPVLPVVCKEFHRDTFKHYEI